MSELGRICILREDADITRMLNVYFTNLGYAVHVTSRVSDIVQRAHEEPPDLILWDNTLSKGNVSSMNNPLYESRYTRHVPLLAIAPKRSSKNKVRSRQEAVTDFLSRPLDLDALKVRVNRIVSDHQKKIHPVTRLPGRSLMEEELTQLKNIGAQAALASLRIDHINPFSARYGVEANARVQQFAAHLMGTILDEVGHPADFLAQPDETFALITATGNIEPLTTAMCTHFNQEVRAFYAPDEAAQGYMQQADGAQAPLMQLSVTHIEHY